MACRGCKRQILLLVRQANSPVTTELYLAAAGQQRLRRATTTPIAYSQRRSYQNMPSPPSLLDTLFRRSADPYIEVKATRDIYEACAKAARYKIDPIAVQADIVPKTPEGEHVGEGEGMWHTDFGLPPTFSTWAQVTMLHMYLFYARFRNLEVDAARTWQAQLADHFFFDAEDFMILNHGISSSSVRSGYLKDLFARWRGIIMAYDEGLVKGDAVLASAVWRNIFNAREDVDVRHLAAIVSWMRLSLKMLDQMRDEALAPSAVSALKWPAKNELALVDKPTRQLGDQLNPNGAPP